jgi:hypothetical protein
MVGHGIPAVSNKSSSSNGVVIALETLSSVEWTKGATIPINVSRIEYFTIGSSYTRIRTGEFHGNSSPAQIRAHRVVCNCSNHGNGSCDIVEYPLTARLRQTQANETGCREAHDRRNSIVPVGAVNIDKDIQCSAFV